MTQFERPDDALEGVRAAALAGADDDEVAALAARFATDGQTAEQVIIGALRASGPPWYADDRERARDNQRVLIRWLTRAANLDQPWALSLGGTDWSDSGSNGSLPHDWALPTGEAVSPEEAQGWLKRAADLGMRPAALAAAEIDSTDPRAPGWLRNAYGDGQPTESLDRGQLCAAAAILASVLASSGSTEAKFWFRRAVEGPRWRSDSPLSDTSWEAAVADFARWAHDHGDIALCAAWSHRLLEDAANHGASTRGYLDSEYKTYRLDWQVARGQYSAHRWAMRHLLEEHDLGEENAWEIALLLADNLHERSADSTLLAATVAPELPGISLTMLMPRDRQGVADPDVYPLNARQVTALTDWVLTEAIPACFRFSGLDVEADEFAEAVRWIPSTDYERTQWLRELESWRRLVGGDVDHRVWGKCVDLARRVLEDAGLAGRTSLYVTDSSAAPDEVDRVGDGSWRLLRGRPLWLGMYLAVADDDRADWVGLWDFASLTLAHAMASCMYRVAQELGIDLAVEQVWKRELQDRVARLGDAFALSIGEFVEAAVMLR